MAILNNFGSLFGQFMQKMAIFEAKNAEANLEKLWVNFWPIHTKNGHFFLGKKGRPILKSIFGQFAQEMAIFSRPKKGGRF